MLKINQKEYEILKNYNFIGVKWISRNENGNLVISKVKPDKIRGKWLPNCPDEDWSELRNSHVYLFQFIQWEDSEPYSIAELIEKYEAGQIISAMAREGATLKVEKESVETEIKNLEWLVQRIQSERGQLTQSFGEDKETDDEGVFNDGKDEALSSVLELIDQLDEPEVLSSDWIDDNSVYASSNGVTEEYVHVDDLKNLLAPKREEITEEQAWEIIGEVYAEDGKGRMRNPKELFDSGRELMSIFNTVEFELSSRNDERSAREFIFDAIDNLDKIVIERPTIPQFVADYIDWCKEEDISLGVTFHSALNGDLDEPVQSWIRKSQEELIKAWLAYPNVEVEEEQKYIIQVSENLFLAQPLGDTSGGKIEVTRHKEDAYKFKDLTSIDTHLWEFKGSKVLKVEELEE